MITIHQRHNVTDGRTDRQTTCDRNTALCTKVHRAVKMKSKIISKREMYKKLCPCFWGDTKRETVCEIGLLGRSALTRDCFNFVENEYP